MVLRSIQYIIYLLINIICFTFISISIYKLLCSINNSIYIIDFNNVYIKNSIIYYYFTNYICLGSFFTIYISVLDITIYNYIFYTSINYIQVFSYSFIYSHLDFFSLTSFDYYSIYKIYFFTKVWTSVLEKSVYFFCLQEYILVVPDETILVFFRIYNCSNNIIECLSIYIVYPFDYNYYLVKLQCFCFSILLISQFELVELPVLLYFNSINLVDSFCYCNKLLFFYLLIVY